MAIWSLEIGRLMARRGAEVTIYSAGDPMAAAEEDGIAYRFVDTRWDWRALRLLEPASRVRPARKPLFASSAYFPTYIRRIASDLRSQAVDVVHVHNFSQFIPVLRRSLPRARLVLHMHADWLSLLDPRLLAGRLDQTDAIVGCSRHITGLTQAAFPGLADRCVTVHNGVDLERFQAVEQGDRGTLRLLTVGRIAPEKGIHVLLDALPRIHEVDPGVEVDLVGPEAPVSVEMLVALSDDPIVTALGRFHPGPYLAPLLDRLPPRSRNRVHVLGKLSHVQTAPQYARADVLVAPSLWEPFGMPIVEGMAAGLPVVASRVGGIPEIVDPDNSGFLVPPGDARSLAKALLALVGDEGLRKGLGSAGRARAERLFSWEGVADAAQTLYEGRAPVEVNG